MLSEAEVLQFSPGALLLLRTPSAARNHHRSYPQSMSRPISWLPRLHLIQRSVANSVRSHYERRDLEQLFELQPRAAQLLMDALPTIGVGRSRLVERESLAALLDTIQKADDPSAALERARQHPKPGSRRRLRELLPHDHPPADFDQLPPQLELAPGQVRIRFGALEELALALLELASLLDTNLDEFARRYEVQPPEASGNPKKETRNGSKTR